MGKEKSGKKTFRSSSCSHSFTARMEPRSKKYRRTTVANTYGTRTQEKAGG